MHHNIREFKPEDTNAFLFLDHQSFPKAMQFTQEQLITVITHPDVVAYSLTTEDNAVIGALIAKLEKFKNELIIISLVIDPKHRKKGIGSTALETVCTIAGHLHVKKISIQVEQANQNAVSFLKKHQFQITEELQDFFSEGNPGYEMQLFL